MNFDELREQYLNIKAPDGLKEKIQSAETPKKENILNFPRSRKSVYRTISAAAAVILLCLGFGAVHYSLNVPVKLTSDISFTEEIELIPQISAAAYGARSVSSGTGAALPIEIKKECSVSFEKGCFAVASDIHAPAEISSGTVIQPNSVLYFIPNESSDEDIPFTLSVDGKEFHFSLTAQDEKITISKLR